MSDIKTPELARAHRALAPTPMPGGAWTHDAAGKPVRVPEKSEVKAAERAGAERKAAEDAAKAASPPAAVAAAADATPPRRPRT